MTRITPSLMVIVLSALAFTGCAEKATVQVDAIAADSASFDEVWDVCLASLEDRGLEVDRSGHQPAWSHREAGFEGDAAALW